MRIVSTAITHDELRQMTSESFGDLVKAVVDVDREVMAVDSELHSDLERYLLEDGSRQYALWGINLYPDATEEDFVEFDSMINLRPAQGNRSRGVDDEAIRREIVRIVNKRVAP